MEYSITDHVIKFTLIDTSFPFYKSKADDEIKNSKQSTCVSISATIYEVCLYIT